MNFSHIKTAYICRDIAVSGINQQLAYTHQPLAGDMALFEVLSIGKHQRIQGVSGINHSLMKGDTLMLAFGARYASAQFEGYVPDGIREEYHILGQGGVVGEVATAHAKFRSVGPTRLRLIGYAVDRNGKVLNTHYQAHPRPVSLSRKNPMTILSIGSSMDSGKTTTAAYLCNGFYKAGKRVAFIKLTGTTYSKDAQLAADLGAVISLDFSHFGFPSTYMYDTGTLTDLFGHLMLEVQQAAPDVVVIEIADGLLQRETAALLQHRPFMRQIDHVVFSSGDSLGMLGGLTVMEEMGIQPTALSGLITASPLLMAEACAHTDLPVLDLAACSSPEILAQHFIPAMRISPRKTLAA